MNYWQRSNHPVVKIVSWPAVAIKLRRTQSTSVEIVKLITATSWSVQKILTNYLGVVHDTYVKYKEINLCENKSHSDAVKSIYHKL